MTHPTLAGKYRLPFISEQPVFVGQAPDGPIFSHSAVSNKNAIDLVMPIGTPIVAARSGYIMENISQIAARQSLSLWTRQTLCGFFMTMALGQTMRT